MGLKHDCLTKKEVEDYELDSNIQKEIELFLIENPGVRGKDFHLLDWGCGRGRAVLNLLEQGYLAYGADIDQEVLENGYPAFYTSGYDPTDYLMPVSRLDNFPEEFFHFIFSEQVFEHVENIHDVIQMQARLLAPGGVGCHIFPSSKMIEECHLNMPFAHWLPKNSLRKLWISMMMLLSKKPDVQWPETENISFWQEAEVYSNYLNKSTFYRDNRTIKQLFNLYGLEAEFIIPGTDSPKRKFIPDFLLQNGFPDQQVCFIVRKKKGSRNYY